MNPELEKKNKALKYLGTNIPDNKRYIFSKLGNELTLIVTKVCNLNCPFCYDKANIYDKKALKKYKNELNANNIINLINVCKHLGVKNIRLTGGEALLKTNFRGILRACNSMHVSLCTNGLILKNNLPKILKLHPNDLHIHLSLDGIESHKKYRIGSDPFKIIQLVKIIKEKHPEVKVSVNTVLNSENIYELCGVYAYLRKLNLDRWTISFPRLVENALKEKFKLPNIENMNNEFIKLLKLYHKDKCPFDFTFSYFYKHELHDTKRYSPPQISMGKHPCLPDANGARGLIVDSFGNILDCLTLKPLLKKPINLKNLLNKNNVSTQEFISKLYSSLKSKFYMLKLAYFKDCLNCRYLKLCKCGCPANAYYLTGRLTNSDITSCLMFYCFEKDILPHLYKEEQSHYLPLIDKSKSIESIKKRIEKNKGILVKIGCLT